MHFPTYFFRLRFCSFQYTSTLLLRFTPAVWFTAVYLDSTFHLSFYCFDQLFCTRVPRQMALCRELGMVLLTASQYWKMCFWTCSSRFLTSLVTTPQPLSSTQAKLNHTLYPPKIPNIYRRKVLHTREENYWYKINYKTSYTNDEYKLRNRC